MVKYYDEFTDKQGEFLNLLYRILSSLSFILYISFFIVYFFGRIQQNFTIVLNIQLCIACMMHSISYLFPSMVDSVSTPTVLCYIQSLLNSLSDLCTIMVATATIIISFLNFKDPDIIINNKKKILLFICLLCWILPLVFCIIIFVYGNVHNEGDAFCWINNYKVIFCYYGFCIINYCTFFIVLYKISKGIKQLLTSDKYIHFFRYNLFTYYLY